MIVLITALSALIVAGVARTIHDVASDGLRRVPTREL
jgi:hypothetical protein